jgi:hypothetical protein
MKLAESSVNYFAEVRVSCSLSDESDNLAKQITKECKIVFTGTSLFICTNV